MSCIILGDSIAQLSSTELPQCEVVAVKGISSESFNRFCRVSVDGKTVVISLGSNRGNDTVKNLIRIRNRITNGTVLWVLPAKVEDRKNVIQAVKPYDKVVTFTPGKDGIHPKYPSLLKEAILKKISL